MSGDWDSEEIIILPKKVVDNKWAGEDDDDENVRDNWDEDDAIDNDAEISKNAEADIKAVQTKKKKSLKERLAEKEEQHQKEIEDLKARKKQELEEKKALTPKQIHEEKMRRQKIQEEADLTLAIEAFGFSSATESSGGGDIDKSNPESKEDFDQLSQLLTNKISKYQMSPIYGSFLESLLRDLILPLGSEDLKKLSACITTLYNDKLKEQKASKTKKKSGKKFEGDDVILGGRNTINEYADYI